MTDEIGPKLTEIVQEVANGIKYREDALYLITNTEEIVPELTWEQTERTSGEAERCYRKGEDIKIAYAGRVIAAVNFVRFSSTTLVPWHEAYDHAAYAYDFAGKNAYLFCAFEAAKVAREEARKLFQELINIIGINPKKRKAYEQAIQSANEDLVELERLTEKKNDR